MAKQIQMTVNSYNEAMQEIAKLPAGSGSLTIRWTDEDPLSRGALDERARFTDVGDALSTLATLGRLAQWPEGSTMTISADVP